MIWNQNIKLIQVNLRELQSAMRTPSFLVNGFDCWSIAGMNVIWLAALVSATQYRQWKNKEETNNLIVHEMIHLSQRRNLLNSCHNWTRYIVIFELRGGLFAAWTITQEEKIVSLTIILLIALPTMIVILLFVVSIMFKITTIIWTLAKALTRYKNANHGFEDVPWLFFAMKHQSRL